MISFSLLRRLETDAIQAIRTLSAFGRLGSLQSAAQQIQIARAAKAIDLNLGFTLPTRLREDPGSRVVERNFHVGCFACSADNSDNISQLTYSVLIGELKSPDLNVARKFHFDFEPATARNQAESKPTYHLQLCGKLSPHHKNAGYEEEHINHLLPSWSQPRIPVQPTSLILVLNWLFMEFGSEQPVINARTEPRWRSLVREAERAVLKPYYESCASFLSAAANEDFSFYSKGLYEEH